MARNELVLYHGIDATGLMQWSTTADTGPWTDARLTEPLPLLDALDAWATLIAAAASRTVSWAWDGSALELTTSGGNLWIKLTPTLQDLLGMAEVIEDGDVSTSTPLGIAEFLVGRNEPREREDAALDEYRGGRASAYHFGRTVDVTIEPSVPADLWDDLAATPLVSAHGARLVTWDEEDGYSETDLDGSMLLYPYATLGQMRTEPNGNVRSAIGCMMADPGTTIDGTTTRTTQWATLMGGVRYGYAPQYILRIEGVPNLLVEVEGDAIAPTNYTLDASLVIDGSSRVGCQIDPKSHISRGLDLEARLMATTATDALMTRPTVLSHLRDDMSATDTGCIVESPVGWADVSVVHIGTSAEVVTAVANRLIGIGTRGIYGRARSYAKGTIVADKPYVWKGRRVELFVALRDPTGRYVQGANVLTDACCVWAGHVQERPYRDGNEWVIQCRDQVRRLAQPLGVAASGKAVWEVDDDGLVAVDPQCAFTIAIDIDGTKIEEHTIRPFVGLTGQKRRSELRTLIAAAFETVVVTSGDVSSFHWRSGVDLPYAIGGVADPYNAYGLFFTYAADGSTTDIKAVCDVQPFTPDSSRLFYSGIERAGLPSSASDVEVWSGLRLVTTAGSVALSVVMDNRAPDLLPTTGWIKLEASGRVSYRRYTDADVDTEDPAKINLTIDATTPFSPDEVQTIIDGSIGEVSVQFFWLDSGRIYDILRRAIVSTGDAVHGSHDTLPKGQGLGLPDIDADSFVDVFDVYFRDLQLVVGVDAGASMEDIFGGWLKLSGRGLTARRASDGSAMEIAAVRVGSADSLPVATITDATLVSTQGRRPVRVREIYAAPQAMEVKCRRLAVGAQPAGEGTISLKDPHLVDWTGDAWTIELYGVGRSTILSAAKAWAATWFRSGENRQVLEVDVPPWIDAQAGDVVQLELEDSHLWDYAQGAAGLSSPARVLGAQLSLQTGVLTLTLAVDGILAAGPMAPSLPIVAVNGGGATPTSIDVDDEFYDLLVAAKDGETTWKVLAYLPGQDAGRAEYTVTTVTQPGGGVARLTVSVYPSAPAVTLSTSYRLTWPVAAQCTDDQDRYLHNTDKAQWG